METTKQESTQHEPIAIIGMGCLFPKAQGTKEYWRLIVNGEDGISEVPESHWSAKDYFDADLKRQDHTYCTRGGFLSPVSFDPTEFGIPPTSLEATDTSQILSLLVAKMALEDAGYLENKAFDRNRVSVILGATGTQELVIKLGSRLGHPIWREALKASGLSDEKTAEVVGRISEAYVPWQESSFPGLLGNVIAGRICNRLDLGGTNCVVDAACASTMSAINLAVLDLAAKRSDMVITGGVDTLNDIFMHMCFAKTYVLSKTGDIRPFSAKSDGTVLGEGIGMLVLKRLKEAQEANDRIYAVIKSVGCSSDGKSQSIYAPHADGQAKALRMAYRNAEVDPATIELIEAHGTGTRVGDAVEFQALKEVFNDSIKNGNRCALGTVKSMIGHAKAAAGAAGIIKAVLALHHKVIPPTLKVDQPDPELKISESPFHISQINRPWVSSPDHPRRSGVSAFGFGGSNFHVVLEEYQKPKTTNAWDGTVEIVPFSASDPEELVQKIDQLKTLAAEEVNLTERLHTLWQMRQKFSHDDTLRLLLVWEAPHADPKALPHLLSGALEALNANGHGNNWHQGNIFFGCGSSKGKLGFMFPGQGSQYPHMGKDLMCVFANAQQGLECFNTQFGSEHQRLLADYLYPNSELEKKQAGSSPLTATDIAQPAIGAVSLGMLNIMETFNIQPDAVCGHSFGELTALYAAGWIDAVTFAHLAVLRGKYMANQGPDSGTMLAVKAPLADLEQLVRKKMKGVVLANRNSHDQGVLSGATDAIDQAETICREAGFATTRLNVAAAFHSSLVEHAVTPFKQALETIDLKTAAIPVYSNTHAQPYPMDIDAARELLGNQLLNPVNFVGQIEAMHQAGVETFVEIGPRTVLSGLARAILKDTSARVLALDHSRGRRSGLRDLARLFCHLSAMGHLVDLSQWEHTPHKPKKQRMNIPVTGANFKPKPKPQVQHRSLKAVTPAKVETPTPPPMARPSEPPLERKTAPPRPPEPTQTQSTSATVITNRVQQKHEKRQTMDTHMENYNTHQTYLLNDALKVVQEGLKSMQAIQAQTAETHQRFLETQTQASKTLQAMMSDTKRMAEVMLTGKTLRADDLPLASSPTFSAAPQEIHQPAAVTTTPMPLPVEPPAATPVAKAAPVPETAPQAQSVPEPQAEPAPSSCPQEVITATMLSVVSELTGYPENMLDMDMDIEADLGIDSIKRVEILSTLEERVPNMPPISPDVLGSLKTLGEIAAYIDKIGTSDPTPPASTASTAPPPVNRRPQIESVLMETVSELTGYPAEMLGPEMDIEADLGIDSIKRVEILSAFEERMPDLPSISPDVMGTLKTLGEIRDCLITATSATADVSAPAEKANEIETSLLDVVSELTGYPVDMLSADMDIEADLGIDSIKRVEILSAFEEKMPNLPPVSPEVMGTLKTLGQICDHLSDTVSQPGGPPSLPVAESNVPQTPEITVAKEDDASPDIESTLLAVVSELTGYPMDMLSAEMDIEADLGIDSIKRVEILSAFEERMPDLPSVSPDVMGTLKTLGQISAYLTGILKASQKESEPVPAQTDAPPAQDVVAGSVQASNATESVVKRYEIHPTTQALSTGSPIGIPNDRKIYIAGPEHPLTTSLTEAFARRQIACRSIPYEPDQDTLAAIDDAGGLIIIAPNATSGDDFDNETNRFMKQAFQLAHAFTGPLMTAGHSGGALFSTITHLDGQFGFSGAGITNPMQGGLAGLAKTAQIEWPEVCCHALDLAPNETVTDADTRVETLVNEMMHTGPVEIGLSLKGKVVPELVETDYPQGVTGLTSNDVVVISGGARGVTAACATALARQAKPFIALLGRSPLPVAEPAWLTGLVDTAAIKKAIVDHEFAGPKVTPIKIQHAYKKHMANREIRENLAKIEQAGARVAYYPIDVRDAQAVSDLLDDIRSQQGPIKAIVHGAGVLEDRFIADKSKEQFKRVFDTKVEGFKALMKAAQDDPLSHIVIFSSVAARFGNKGQVDYAMANEALNKIAQKAAATRKDCSVSAINWGPWDGGMVTPALKKEFQRQQIELIPLEAGAEAMVKEMTVGATPAVEVVIGAKITSEPDRQQALSSPSTAAQAVEDEGSGPLSTSGLSVTLTSAIDTRRFPILNAHKLNGLPVVPFALMAEWFGHGALHGNPGLQLLGLDDMRLMSGIKLDEAMKEINLLAGKARKTGDAYEVALEIRNTGLNGKGLIHSKAKALLGMERPAPPVFSRSDLLNTNGYKRTAAEIYDKVLFHGTDLHGIKTVMSCTPKAMVAQLDTAPPPSDWLSEPVRSRWIADPLVLDSAFQMASLWCYEQTGVVSLPSYGACYRQFVRTFPQGRITCILEINTLGEHKMTGDFTFIDDQHTVIATLSGYEAVMDQALNRAFKPQGIRA